METWKTNKDGLVFRSYTGEADLPELVSVFNASSQADKADWVTNLVEMSKEYQPGEHFDPQRDSVLVERDGRLVAFGEVRHYYQQESGSWQHRVDGLVRPDWRGHGIGSALLEQLRGVCAGLAESGQSEVGHRLHTYAWGTQTARLAFLEAAGFSPVEFMYSMTRTNLNEITITDLPEGLQTRAVLRSDARDLWNLFNEAFLDHPGFFRQNEADFLEWESSSYFDPELCVAAWEGERMVGMVINHIDAVENREMRRERGYLMRIATLREWRKRGVARALIGHSLKLLNQKGCNEAALRVNVRNPTGALHLYESLGFVVTSQLKIMEMDLKAGLP
ncbi:hypothetical protein ADN00_06895 [Ornatilinea apprima]|uniref:N-acetyltransferase domain-containing protein n=1 Tax=Ornatilinea apprima TaxID=1134406 RepID=A0A0P6XXT8_9CHLR|nr:GNAT family N-acetyltransferase [Ornatilinea apprima]KPL78209.1 hypothetical protein ADN00_06895 [Ornatilinea apprima]